VTKSKIFFYSCLFFILGVGIGSYFVLPFWIVFCLLVSGCFALLIGWPGHKKLIIVGLGGIFLFLGILRYEASLPMNNENQIQFYNGKKLTLMGIVADEPDVRTNHVKLKIKNIKLKINENWKKVEGNVLVNAKLYPEYRYGDELEITCEFKKPEPVEEFAYDKYLAKEGIYSLCYWPEIKFLKRGQGNKLISALLAVKSKFVGVVNKILPEPQASFLGGLLYGARRGIPSDLMEAFNATGTTHIVAVSGYNITIIAALILKLNLAFGISRRKSFWISLLGISFFVIIAGAQASVVRAAIMGGLALLANQVGRVSRVTNALLFAAAMMLIFNPKILAFDVGFQLSFAATIGLIFLAPIFEKYFTKLPSVLGVKESFVTTMSAIVLTLPLILYNFGRVSIVAPLANVLILPVIPFTMAVGFIAAIGGLFYFYFGWILGWLAWFFLSYIIKVVEFLSKFPWINFQISKVHWVVVAVFYLAIGLFIFYRQKNLKFSKT
jgi:competence protein ComEC